MDFHANVVCMEIPTSLEDAESSRLANEIRAEMARQRRTAGELAEVLGVGAHTVGRRLNGEIPFDVRQLYSVARWLGVSLVVLIERAAVETVGAA